MPISLRYDIVSLVKIFSYIMVINYPIMIIKVIILHLVVIALP